MLSSGPIAVGIDVNEDNVIDFFSLVQSRRATTTIAIPLSTLNPNGGVQQAIRNIRVMTSTSEGVVSANQDVLVKRMRREFNNGVWTFTVGASDTDVSVEARVDEQDRATFVVTDRRGLAWSTGSENQLASNLIIYGGSNSNRIDVSKYSRNTTIFGGAGSDTIIGSAQADVIYGDGLRITAGTQNGNDSIDGGAGNDLIVGDGAEGSQSQNRGNDTIRGGEGNDTIYSDVTVEDGGEGGNDLLYGDAGDDSIDARSGRDTAYGGEGQDTIIGVIDSDLVFFSSGRSTFSGITNTLIPSVTATASKSVTKPSDAASVATTPEMDSLVTDVAISSWNTSEWSVCDFSISEGSTFDPWEIGLQQDPLDRGPTRASRRAF